MKVVKLTSLTLALFLILLSCAEPFAEAESYIMQVGVAVSESCDSVTEKENTSESAESLESTEAVLETETEENCSASITAAVVPSEGNYGIGHDVVGVIDNGRVIFTPTLIAGLEAMADVAVNVTADGGTFAFSPDSLKENGRVDLVSGKPYITVTDTDGNTKKYFVEVEYEPLGLPVVSIDTGGDEILREDYTDAAVSVSYDGVTDESLFSGLENISEADVKVRGRGHSTWKIMPKKPYKLKFEEKTSLLGLKAAKDWVLLANYADMSLLRNSVAFETAKIADSLGFTPTQYPVNLFVNGKYAGVYSLGEQLEVKSGRVELGENTFADDTSFLIEIGGTENTEDFGKTAFNLSDTCFRFCAVKYPDEAEITPEQVKFMEGYIKEADRAVRSGVGYEEYIDVDSMIDWFIVHELFYNLESCFRRSFFFTKEAGGKLKFGPVWDFDLAMGNLYNDFGNYSAWMCLSQSNGYIWENWFSYLMYNDSFRVRLRERWNEIKEPLLKTATETVDRMGALISPSAEYNFKLWNTLGTRSVAPQPLSIVELDTYEKHVSYVREFIVNRWNWIDKNI